MIAGSTGLVGAIFSLTHGLNVMGLTLCSCRGLYLIPHSCIIVFKNTIVYSIVLLYYHDNIWYLARVYNELNLCGGSGHPGHVLLAPQSSKYLQR